MWSRSCLAFRLPSLQQAVVLLVLAIISLAFVDAKGEPVSPTDGERAAQAFLHAEVSRSPAYRAALGVSEGVRIKEETEFRDPESGELLGYVFALDPSGYLVMPAETRLVPVIAYAYAGEFPWEESEENILLAMLRFDLRARIEATAQGLVPSEAYGRNEGSWGAYLGSKSEIATGAASPTVYGPHLTTEWHQEGPYWDDCPPDAVCGEQSLVCCVATALSQIMNYWRYPTEVTFTADDSYTTATHGFAIDAPAASFAGLDYATGEPSDADKARLCYAAGVSVRVDYCHRVSWAYTYEVAAALAGSGPGSVPQRWGYESADVRSCNANYASWGDPYYVAEAEFYSTLSDNMIDGLPVELDIASWSGGHAIVVDGWQSEGRVYHLNFGKGGSHSGWYSLPEGMPAGYSVVRYAVTNIRPPSPAGTGDVYGFGLNSYGELGLGDTTERHTPAKIATLSGEARAVAAGDSHSLVLLENGDVYSFGSNIDAVLGLGDWIPHYTPTKITTLPGPAAAVAAGYVHSLVLLQNGDVYTFGWNQLGQLGLGDTSQSYSPRRITTLPGAAVAVAGGYAHSLVVLDNGDVYTFGLNQFGQLGLGDTTERHTPTKITTLPAAATAVAGGQWHSLVLLENGDVYGFGSNSHGALGLGDTTERHTPTKITTLPVAATAVAGGTLFSLVLLENGDVYAFGLNSYGQLGLGDTTERHTPAKIATLSGEARAVAAGDSHSLVLLENGDVYGFGRNSYGQLGLGDTTERHTPTKIATLSGAVATGEDHSFAVLGAPPSPFAPSDVVASDGAYASKVRVAWNVASGATLYVVHRTAGPHETFVEIAELTGNSYDDSHVAPGRIYWYKVAACSGSGCSDLSTADSGFASTTGSSRPATFRITSSGDVRVDGGLYGGNLFVGSADVAEWVPVSEVVEAGTVLELDAVHPGSYRPSQSSCSSLVAGVVSSQPGMVLGGTGSMQGMALLALTGIVPVKVTNEGGPIQPGDLLVSSSTPGYAMRWAGPEPCPCALVGKALEPMTGERGVISVLLTAH